MAEVGGDDFLVPPDLLRDPAGDQLAVIKAVHLVGDVHDETDVVFDEQYSHPRVPDHTYPLDEILSFTRVHPGRRLIQQKQPGFGGQGAGDLHQTLLAVRETGRGQHGLFLETHQLESVHCSSPRALLLAPL